jgi:hypothetical protein
MTTKNTHPQHEVNINLFKQSNLDVDRARYLHHSSEPGHSGGYCVHNGQCAALPKGAVSNLTRAQCLIVWGRLSPLFCILF